MSHVIAGEADGPLAVSMRHWSFVCSTTGSTLHMHGWRQTAPKPFGGSFGQLDLLLLLIIDQSAIDIEILCLARASHEKRARRRAYLTPWQ